METEMGWKCKCNCDENLYGNGNGMEMKMKIDEKKVGSAPRQVSIL